MLDPFVIVITRQEVESVNITRALNLLQPLLASPQTARSHFEKIDVAFDGYDDDTRELFEIPDVRDFVFKLDEAFPYWGFIFVQERLGFASANPLFHAAISN